MLFELIDSLKQSVEGSKFKIYATAIFRKLSANARLSFIDEFYEKTGIFFNIIDQDLENFYLENALIGRCGLNKAILLINIGGGSTELVLIKQKRVIERINLDLGAGTILSKFRTINNTYSAVDLRKVVNFIKKNLPILSRKVDFAFHTGGELTYMQLAQYLLKPNNLFHDDNHPVVIETSEFCKKNKQIFHGISLNSLEKLMPDNPKWMHGARACSAIAQAVCEKYKIKTLIPSDANLIHGVARQELRQVTISGSFRKHLIQILKIKKQLENAGILVLSPRFMEPKNPDEEFVVFNGEEGVSPLQLERYHLNSITKSDALIICNPQGYVGASALIEIGYAHALGKRVIFTEKPQEFMLNTLPAEVGL